MTKPQRIASRMVINIFMIKDVRAPSCWAMTVIGSSSSREKEKIIMKKEAISTPYEGGALKFACHSSVCLVPMTSVTQAVFSFVGAKPWLIFLQTQQIPNKRKTGKWSSLSIQFDF